MIPVLKRLAHFYKWYALVVLALGYLLAELGHFLLGVTSKAIAKELHYGDKACQYKNATEHHGVANITQCETLKELELCGEHDHCEWDYNGLGWDYQVLAGPSFILVYTVVGVFCGIVADRFNRVRMLVVATLAFGLAVLAMGAANRYWHLVVLRVILAAGEAACNPMSTGILSDIFRADERGLVMSIFNWGIYGGYGLAFPVGRYVTLANIWDLSWRACYYITGAVAVLVAITTGVTVQEPKRLVIGEEKEDNKEGKEAKNPWLVLVKVLIEPRILLLCFAASIRHCGGICFAYNCDLFYNTYYPGSDLGWPLFIVTVIVGSIGVMLGGIISDKFVSYMGVRGRLLVLAISQLIATPFAFGSVYFGPLWAMITLGVSYLFAEMWFGILFATLVEIVPMAVRSTTVGIFLFVMNQIGGNLPVFVEPVSKVLGYREAMYIFYVGFQFASSILFFGTMFFMPKKRVENTELEAVRNGDVGVQQITTVSGQLESVRL